jgi:hypothetical protein
MPVMIPFTPLRFDWDLQRLSDFFLFLSELVLVLLLLLSFLTIWEFTRIDLSWERLNIVTEGVCF